MLSVNQLKKAEELKGNKKSISREVIKDALGVSDKTARVVREILCNKEEILLFLKGEKSKTNKTSVEKETTTDTQTITTRSEDITTLDDLLNYCDVDLNEYEVWKHTVNSWEVTMSGDKTLSGKPETYTNFQVKAWLKKKNNIVNPSDILKRFELKAKEKAPSYKRITHKNKSEHMLEICTHDFHFGQLSWGKETGYDDYDIKIAKKLYLDSIQYFLHHAQTYNPEKIIFLVGSDWYNSNNADNSTARGTRQDEDSRWKKTFTEGWELVVDSVDMCREIANVELIVVPGNHDGERSYYMGEVLSAWYNKCNNVHVDNSPTTRKYYKYGKNLLGYTHGDKEKLDELPLIMAQEAHNMWGETTTREFKTGHLHHKKKFIFMPLQEHQAVRVVQCPTLAAPDAWHSEKGYHSVREANGNIWHKEKGNIANFNYLPSNIV